MRQRLGDGAGTVQGMRNLGLPLLGCLVLLTACPSASDTSGSKPPPAADATSPTVTLTRGGPDAVQAGTLTAIATDNVGVVRVEFYQNGALLAGDTTAPYTFEANLLGNRKNFTAKAIDAAGNVGTSAPFDIVTQNQGVWAWAIGTEDGATVLDSGAVLFYNESTVLGYGPVAKGFFLNETETVSGDAGMGPFTGPGLLQVSFFKVVRIPDGALASSYLSGADADGQLGLYQGKAVFEGTGRWEKTTGAYVNTVVALLQFQADIPVGEAAQASAAAGAKKLAIRALSQRTPAPATGKIDAKLARQARQLFSDR